jgi:hypothetical protein
VRRIVAEVRSAAAAAGRRGGGGNVNGGGEACGGIVVMRVLMGYEWCRSMRLAMVDGLLLLL